MMNNEERSETRFVEVQYFWQQPLAWIVWVISAVMLYWLSSADLIEETFAIIAAVFVIAIIILVFFTTLKTEISEEGIKYRMWPFHKKSKVLFWHDIESAEIRKYKPIREYGGWGMRFGHHGRAFNVKGDIGLQITLVSGKKILIGTQRSDELEDVLNHLNS